MRVYRYDEATQLPQPTPHDFARELDFARGALTSLHSEGLISGAYIYGSAVTDPTPRSDIDVMVSMPEVTMDALVGVRGLTRTVHERAGISVDVAHFADDDLRNGNHDFREHMLTWLGWMTKKYPENIVGRHPLEITTPPRTELLASIDILIGTYLRNFRAAFLRGHHPRPEPVLEDVLNLPHKSGRHTIGSLLVRGRVPEDVLSSAKKLDIADAVRNVFGADDPKIAELYDEITGASAAYTEFIEMTHQGRVSREEYDGHVVDLIEAYLPRAILLTAKMRQAFRARAGLTDT